MLTATYNETYYGSGRKKFPGLLGFAFDWLRSMRARRIEKLLHPQSQVLDIGCGSGVFLEGLKRFGHICHGVELPGAAAKRASQIEGINLYVGDLASVELPSNYFDFIMAWHVIEHLSNPRQALDIITRCIRTGGVATIALPNIESIQSRIFRARWFPLDFPRHLSFLPAASLIKEMERRGFKLIFHRNFSLEYDPFGYQQSFLLLFGERGALLYEMMKGNKMAVQGRPWALVLLPLYFAISMPFGFLFAIGESLLGRGGSIELGFRKVN